ncbi:DUF2069 domain-containing protein [Guyparkeria hydrothermalis]|uniref:DUF2069 domain-containing protein n=1 Tax=Guyparkeria TaxID=2035712 RepID=UPI0010ABB749|nr:MULTISPECIES: DUF2069 domain-containing protein [Guyparkeria]MCL7752042.1 DUF2069 domain-containing protein [Guyparkeria hydrothermalis]TKA89303.1 DUF2069 domain-containing protein [Guyparkeria sp. SB14A]
MFAGRTSEGLPIWPLRLMALGLLTVIAGYLGLLLAGRAEIRPGGLTTTFMLLPGIVVLPGLWLGHYKTMIWAALVALFYLLISATDAWAVAADRGWHLLIAVAATVAFLAAWWHSIKRRRYLKARHAKAQNGHPEQANSKPED